jgi:hypothetical protein
MTSRLPPRQPDLRGKGRGGAPAEVARLLGAFAHGKITSYDCDVGGACTPNRTDDSVPLLGLRLVALVDRGCASACEDFSAAVKDLGLGVLVGTRTAGGSPVRPPAGCWTTTACCACPKSITSGRTRSSSTPSASPPTTTPR